MTPLLMLLLFATPAHADAFMPSTTATPTGRPPATGGIIPLVGNHYDFDPRRGPLDSPSIEDAIWLVRPGAWGASTEALPLPTPPVVTPCVAVPGPAGVLGLGMAFGWARRIRRKAQRRTVRVNVAAVVPHHPPSQLTVEPLDVLDPVVQLEQLRQLSAAWLDGEGVPPSSELLGLVGEWLEEHQRDDVQPPRLYPTPEGGVEAEWRIGRLDLSIEFDANSATADCHALDLDSGAVHEQQVSLQDGLPSSSLARWVRQARIDCGLGRLPDIA